MRARHKPGKRSIVIGAAALVLIVAMALDTKVVTIGSPEAVQPNVFSPDAFGAAEFPQIKAGIESRAVEAQVLAQALTADKAAAIKQYGMPAGTGGQVFSVKFTGVAGDAKSPYRVSPRRSASACRPDRRSTAPISATRPALSSSAASSIRSNIRTPDRRSTGR
jgi:hypothetical protein